VVEHRCAEGERRGEHGGDGRHLGGAADERQLWRGLAQLAVGLTLIFGVLRNALPQIPGATFYDRLIVGVVVVLINLLVDLSYGLLDPKVRYR
jgi:hypothetical protein